MVLWRSPSYYPNLGAGHNQEQESKYDRGMRRGTLFKVVHSLTLHLLPTIQAHVPQSAKRPTSGVGEGTRLSDTLVA
jgi:hypothetical protein